MAPTLIFIEMKAAFFIELSSCKRLCNEIKMNEEKPFFKKANIRSFRLKGRI